MREIIWNKEQLINIKRMILARANLKYTAEGELVQCNTTSYNNFPKNGRALYIDLQDELEKLFYTTDKTEIRNTLFKASQIKINENNNLGFLHNISKVNPNNPEEIFFIFKEIISQYEKAIDMVAKNSLEKVDNLEEAKRKIREIHESTEETTEERLVKIIINKIFIQSNGVTESCLFDSLNKKIESLIKAKLITRMQSIVSIQSRNEEMAKNKKIYGTSLSKYYRG